MKNIKYLALIIFISLIFGGCSNSSSTNNNGTDIIDKDQEGYTKLLIPFREHGYSNFETLFISSKEAYDSFISVIDIQEDWNDKESFVSSFNNIDFEKNNVILYRITEGSGSIELKVNEPIVDNNRLIVNIDRIVPDVGTDDMAYYAIGYAIDKSIDSIDFKIGNNYDSILNRLNYNNSDDITYQPICGYKNTICEYEPCEIEQKTFLNQSMFNLSDEYTFLFNGICPNDAAVPLNCTNWYDGCNNCGVSGNNDIFCTEIYCTIPSGEIKCNKF